MNAKGDPDLPAAAFEQVGIYRLEVALLVFYGGLLLVTPVLAGLIRGRLPVEISTRGAKFAEETGQSAERDEEAIKSLEKTADNLEQRLSETQLEIKRLNEIPGSDRKQPEVGSSR